MSIRKRKPTKNPITPKQASADDGTFATGVVVSHFGKQLDVQITALPEMVSADASLAVGQIWRCHTRNSLTVLTSGDRVKISLDESAGMGRIEQLLSRTTLITRPDRYHKVKPVASNVAILAIIFAPLPKPATGLIDRYLLVARHSNVTPLLVLNKADLLDSHDEVKKIYQEYQELGKKYGFDVIQSSSGDLSLLDELKTRIQGKLTVFAGQSGVGKSSLINQILPHAQQSTNIISVGSQLGQHTTTASRLLAYDVSDLSKGGVIDTPGIREYGIWHLSADDILQGFDELNELNGACQFRDCNHAPNAKGCAFWQAVADGEVLARRVESFRELVAEAKQGATSIKS